jgi:hypothetical protein
MSTQGKENEGFELVTSASLGRDLQPIDLSPKDNKEHNYIRDERIGELGSSLFPSFSAF